METVLIVGVFSFVGYEIAQQCMKKGVTVYGLQPMPLCQVHEEKWLRIGRNANFLFTPSLQECPEDIDKVYVCLYESHREDYKDTNLLKEVIKKYPHSMVISSVRAESSHSFFQQVEAVAQDCMIIRLPTVYGPWQPEEMSFQRIINGKKIFSVEEEEIQFITDVAVALLEINREKGCYTLTAKDKYYWQDAYYELTGERQCETYVSNIKIKKLGISNITSVKNGIEKQKKHVQQERENEKEMDK